MNTLLKITTLAAFTAMVAAGCGKNISGTYTGTDVATIAQTQGQQGNSCGGGTGNVSLQIQQNGGNTVTGTWNETMAQQNQQFCGGNQSNSSPSASIVASYDGTTLTISNMIMTVGSSYGSYTCVYSGGLTISDKSMTGSLSGTESGGGFGQGQGQGQGQQLNLCPVRTVTLVETSS